MHRKSIPEYLINGNIYFAMLIFLDEDPPSRREIRSQQQKVEDCQEEAMSVMEALMDKYQAEGDQEGIRKINEQLETLEKECTSAENRAQEYLDSRVHEESNTSEKSTRRKMSNVKENRIQQWRIESAERRKQLVKSEKQTELVNQKRTVLDPRVIKEKEEEILREIEMEQQELRQREMKIISVLINKNSRKKVRRSREEVMQGLEMKGNR